MSSDDRWVKALSEVHNEPAPSGPMDKARTIEALHAAFTELQISICSVSKVEHETRLPYGFKVILKGIITDMEAMAERIENAENIARASLAK